MSGAGLAQWQADLVAHALQGDRAAHERLVAALAPTPVPASIALAVHADCVHAGLRHALAQRVPTVVAMVGEEFFTVLARDFARTQPPAAPQLSCWGEALPDHLAGRADCAAYPWLPELATFDLALDRVAWADPAAVTAPIPLDADHALQPLPGLRVLPLQYPVDELREAVAAELAGDAGALARLDLGPAPRHVVLWCAEDARVHCRTVPADTAAVLEQLLAAVAAEDSLGRADGGEAAMAVLPDPPSLPGVRLLRRSAA
jgi:hypothetical protein